MSRQRRFRERAPSVPIEKIGEYRWRIPKSFRSGMRVPGMVFADDIDRSGIVYNLMKEGINVETFKEVLVAEDFGLSSLPEEIWRPWLAIPASLLASSVTPVEQPEEVFAGE